MVGSISGICEKFIQNRDILKDTFKWESAYMYPVCAAVFTDKHLTANSERLSNCKEILKEQTGIFSDFRGYAMLPMISMLAVDNNPQEKLRRSLQVYANLKEHFFSSEYLPIASMIIADLAEPVKYESIAKKTREIYDLMKNEHPFLTSREDSVFAVLLALSEMTDEQIVSATEECYQILKPQFFMGNAVQSLSHVLSLGDGTSEEKCQKTMEIFYKLKEKGRKYGTGYELATLGVLALIPDEVNVIVQNLMEADDFLARQKGYGFFGMDRKMRMMHASMIVSSAYTDQMDNLAMKSAAFGGTISLIVAQQAAMCAAIAASTAAANASNGC